MPPRSRCQRDFDIVDIQGVSPTDGVSVFVLPCEQGRFDEGDLFGKCPVRLRDLFRITVIDARVLGLSVIEF